MNCPLCRNPDSPLFYRSKDRDFYRCHHCRLIFVPANFHLSPQQELARYRQHTNTLNDQGYVRYLSSVAETLEQIPALPGSSILDFGCGEEAVLVSLLKERGYCCDGYDPLYEKYSVPLHTTYDMVIASEVVEHFRDPADQWFKLVSYVKPGGYGTIRTEFYPARENFPSWWYIQDKTHLSFYSPETFIWILKVLGCSLFYTNNKNIIQFQKTVTPQ